MSNITEKLLPALERNLDGIKKAVVFCSSVPREMVDVEIMKLTNSTFDIIKDLKKELEALLATKSGEAV